jgi:dTMP kinase
VVISDRYDLSTIAYQGAGRELPLDHVRWVNQAATGGLVPDLTLVLDVDPAIALERQQRAGKGLDRVERESAEFHRRVAGAYRAAAGPGVRHIQADGSAESVLEASWRALIQSDVARFQSRPS